MELEFKGIRLWDFEKKRKEVVNPSRKNSYWIIEIDRDSYFQLYHETFQSEPGYESNLRPHKSVRLAHKIILH